MSWLNCLVGATLENNVVVSAWVEEDSGDFVEVSKENLLKVHDFLYEVKQVHENEVKVVEFERAAFRGCFLSVPVEIGLFNTLKTKKFSVREKEGKHHIMWCDKKYRLVNYYKDSFSCVDEKGSPVFMGTSAWMKCPKSLSHLFLSSRLAHSVNQGINVWEYDSERSAFKVSL